MARIYPRLAERAAVRGWVVQLASVLVRLSFPAMVLALPGHDTTTQPHRRQMRRAGLEAVR